jgi:hypothetical protein
VLQDSVPTETFGVYCSLGPSNPLRISFTLLKSLVNNLRRYKQGDSRSKMAGARFHSTANSHALIPRFSTTIISPWQTAFQCLFRPVAIRSQIQTPDFGNQQNVHFRCGNHTAISQHWVKNLSAEFSDVEWKTAPAILHRETACLKCCIFFMRDYTSVKRMRGAIFRPKLYISGLSWYTI